MHRMVMIVCLIARLIEATRRVGGVNLARDIMIV